MKKIVKNTLLFGMIFLAILISLNYIPVKFAKEPQKGDIIYNDTCKIGIRENKGAFIELLKCKYDVGDSENFYEPVMITGKVPQICLNQKTFNKTALFNRYYERDDRDKIIYNTTNFFYLYGEKTNVFKTGVGVNVNVVSVDDWDIVYPIQRHGFRRYITPTKYLTIYDYDWINVLKSWIAT